MVNFKLLMQYLRFLTILISFDYWVKFIKFEKFEFGYFDFGELLFIILIPMELILKAISIPLGLFFGN